LAQPPPRRWTARRRWSSDHAGRPGSGVAACSGRRWASSRRARPGERSRLAAVQPPWTPCGRLASPTDLPAGRTRTRARAPGRQARSLREGLLGVGLSQPPPAETQIRESLRQAARVLAHPDASRPPAEEARAAAPHFPAHAGEQGRVSFLARLRQAAYDAADEMTGSAGRDDGISDLA